MAITFSFPKALEDLNENHFDEVIRHSDSLMSYDSDTREIFAELHIPAPDSRHAQDFNVEKIRKIFEQLHDIRPKEKTAEEMQIDAKTKESENSKAKN